MDRRAGTPTEERTPKAKARVPTEELDTDGQHDNGKERRITRLLSGPVSITRDRKNTTTTEA